MSHFARVVQTLVRLHDVIGTIAIQISGDLDLLCNPACIIPLVIAAVHGRIVHIRTPVFLSGRCESIVQHTAV